MQADWKGQLDWIAKSIGSSQSEDFEQASPKVFNGAGSLIGTWHAIRNNNKTANFFITKRKRNNNKKIAEQKFIL